MCDHQMEAQVYRIYDNGSGRSNISKSPLTLPVITIDRNQFLDHVVWPVSGTVVGIDATSTVRIGMLPHKASVIFDLDDEVSAKVLESNLCMLMTWLSLVRPLKDCNACWTYVQFMAKPMTFYLMMTRLCVC